MDWQTQLITLYLFVCDHFAQGLWVHAQRFAPYADRSFTDEEVVTIYLAGLLDKKRETRTIHDHARAYWGDWFPRLPGYGAYVRRPNRLAAVFPTLLERLCPEGPPRTGIGLIDSQPVIMAQQSRRSNAKVARQELANSAYCSTKKLYDHGVKIHAIGDYRPGALLPLPRHIGVTPAGMNDGPALESVAPVLAYREVYSDKAYEYLTRNPNLPFAFLTPVKKKKGQERLDSAAVSRRRHSPSNHCSTGSRRKLASSVPVRSAPSTASWSMSSPDSPPPCSCRSPGRNSPNSHYSTNQDRYQSKNSVNQKYISI